MAYALDGFANAAEALVGRAVGAKDSAGLRVAVRRSLQWCVGAALIIATAFAVAGPGIVDLLTSLEPVRQVTREYLPWAVVAPLVCVWCYLYDGVFVGATLARQMRDSMLISLVLFIGLWWLLRPWANHGLWLAFMGFNAARGLLQHFWFARLQAQGRLA